MKTCHLLILPLLWYSSGVYALPILKINFIFSTDHPQAKKYNTLDQMNKEIQILNQYFITEYRHPIFDFRINSFIDYKSFKNMNCSLFDVLHQNKAINHLEVKKSFNNCFKKGKGEIYFFIYDAYSDPKKFKSITSWGFNNFNHPFVLIDWERLNYNIQAAEIHEMGHALGLRHVCAPHAKLTDSTNIMASSECKSGTGGKRNIGFNQNQLKIILKSYRNIGN